MTVSSATRKAGPFLGNDSSTSFPFDFKVFSKSDLAITLMNSAGVETTLVLDSDYSVTLNSDQNSNPGGSVTYPISGDPLVTGSQLTISGSLAEAQPTDITNLGGFYPSVIEDALDRLTIIAQQLRELVDRALKFPVSDEVLIAELPTAAIRANKTMVFDGDGNVTASAVDASGIGDLEKITYTAGVDFTAGVSTTLTLPEDPVTKSNVAVIFDEAWQQQTGFEISGTTLTFDAAIPADVAQIEVVYSVPLPMGVPSLGSVSAAQLANLAVTTAKLADLAVTTAKLANLSVTTEKLAELNVTTAKLADLAVTTAKLADLAVTTEKMLDANVTQAKLATNVAGTGPAFSAGSLVDQTVTSAVATKATLGTEVFDTHSCFASNRFTPTVAGYYQINATIAGSATSMLALVCAIYKNGVEYSSMYMNYPTASTNSSKMAVATLVYMNGTTDYVELYGSVAGSSNVKFNLGGCSLSGFLARAA